MGTGKGVSTAASDVTDMSKQASSSQDAGRSGNTPEAGVTDNRVRYLRACDRCRRRKIKCDSAFPCGKCSAAKAECQFGLEKDNNVLNSSSSSRQQLEPSAKRQRISRPAIPATATPGSAGLVLDHEETAHFYTTHEGVPRFAGSSSGLPLLDAARRHLQQNRGGPKTSTGTTPPQPDWNWLSSLLESAPEDETSQKLKQGGGEGEDEEEVDFFPGKDILATPHEGSLFSIVTATIPSDLLTTLVHEFFEVVHPSWPILHRPSFFAELYRWQDPSFAALVVSMCMLASRYTKDVRVYDDPSNPATAGLRFYHLFKQLRDQAINRDNVIYSVQSLFFASLYHCVDSIPHPVAQSILSEAITRCIDGGLHREIKSIGDPIQKEIRTRTGWACYCLDKHFATYAGRMSYVRLWDYEISLPTKFVDTGSTPESLWPVNPVSAGKDEQGEVGEVEVFRQFVLICAVLERTLAAILHRPIFDNSDFLVKLSRELMPETEDEQGFRSAEKALDEWRRGLPGELGGTVKERRAGRFYSPASETLNATEATIKMLIASRRLHLATIHDPKQHSEKRKVIRDALLAATREQVNIAVHLGSMGQLNKCDALLGYRLLLAGRLNIACEISARSDEDKKQTLDAVAPLHACSVMLRHLSTQLHITLGAAEVFDETCRVCRIPLPKAAAATTHTPYAWYRPLRFTKPRGSKAPTQDSSLLNLGNGDMTSADDGDNPFFDMFDFSPVDVAFAETNFAVPFPGSVNGNVAGTQTGVGVGLGLDGAGENINTEFSWLLPGGNIPYYFPDQQL